MTKRPPIQPEAASFPLTIIWLYVRINWNSVNRESSAEAGSARNTFTLPRNISAIQALPEPDGGVRLGTILQLPEGTQVRVCGDGFNDRTVRVIWEGGYFFIFLEDIEPGLVLGAKTHASA